MSRKVLIITYYWPPSGGPGVPRVLKFTRYLPDFGWTPIILTVSDGEYPAYDHTLEKQIPKDVKVVRTTTKEYYSLFKRLTGRKQSDKIATYVLKEKNPSFMDRIFKWIRLNMFIPDARVGWVRFAVKAGMEICENDQPDVIFCSTPPHSAQLIAQTLSNRYDIPWVADFRDPITDAFWLTDLNKYPKTLEKYRRFERTILNSARAITTVSKGYKNLLGKNTEKDIRIIHNGYDSADFALEKKPSDKFRINYSGSLSRTQHPRKFFEAVNKLRLKYPDKIEMNFWGSMDQSVHDHLVESGLNSICNFHGYVPHAEALQGMMDAELLLLLTPFEQGEGMMPLKMYEYMATGNFICCIAESDSDTAEMIRKCEAGIVIDYETDPGDKLVEVINNWEQKKTFQNNTEAVSALERKALTKQLVELFEEVCN